MIKFSQTSEHGTVIKVWPGGEWVNVEFLGGYTYRSLTYVEAVELADAIAEAAEEIKPKPSKAERIRALLDQQMDKTALGREEREQIREILAEDGPL